MTVSNLAERSDNLYESTIEFSSLNTSDGGNYECEATVTADPQSQFVIMSRAGSDTHSVTVHGEIQLLNQWLVYTMMLGGRSCVQSVLCTSHVIILCIFLYPLMNKLTIQQEWG